MVLEVFGNARVVIIYVRLVKRKIIIVNLVQILDIIYSIMKVDHLDHNIAIAQPHA